ncbi:protein hunchback [Phlebotomus papatasi]|uniref:Protein hunchback n=1 Tax=Phlebotomus papatasi TaxID=29031 RepID=A0A1B0D510_PHLPP|nr:protein hunchback [Phlebotomus papatasi]
MHSWEVIQQPINYDHHWYGNVPIKRESPDIATYTGQNTTMGHESSASSPTSMHSEESSHHGNQSVYGEIHAATSLHMSQMRQPGFNPLTPPGYPSAVIPPNSTNQPAVRQNNESPTRSFLSTEGTYPLLNNLTPTNSPPMNVTPPKSPKNTKHIEDGSDNTDANCDMDDETRSNCSDVDDDAIRTPKVNSHGKVKTYRCKQCDFYAITKVDFWEHSRNHMKPERILTCHLCPFVTEYKHHLEYHLHKHLGSKPFKCEQCDYSCVNKSMLNSHLKSHSNIYQYRCATCKYATKYCHSLKLHLRKYRHQPAMVLNSDGTPNPLPIIDVYGTRRGPRTRKSPKGTKSKTPPTSPSTQNKTQATSPLAAMASGLLPNFANMLQNGSMPLIPYLNFQQILAMQQLSQISPSMRNSDEHSRDMDTTEDTKPNQPELNLLASTALDLTQQSCRASSTDRESLVEEDKKSHSSPASSTSSQSGKNKRKGRAVRLDLTKVAPNDEQEIKVDTEENTEETRDEEMLPPQSPIEDLSSRKVSQVYECKFCDITFKDAVLYTIHMGYHGYNDVFQCNMCGEKSDDRVAFFLHIARNPHS